jgi:hypothetical protein
MNNLLKKAQIVQFIIIISFIMLSNLNNDEKILEKNTDYYDFLVNIVKYNNFIKQYIKNKHENIEELINIINDNNEYFYFFYNENNVLTYFFKEKNSKDHSIYFCGIDNVNDIKTMLTILINNYSFENIEKILNKDGILYKINNDSIEKVIIDVNIYNTFDYLDKNIYNKYSNIYNIYNEDNTIYTSDHIKIYNESNNEKINLNVNGYSLGGPFSQVFVYNIIKKDSVPEEILSNELNDSKFNIKIFNIESWFGGNKEIYDELTKNIEIFNTYNNKSVLYFFNIIFQKYFKSDFIIKNNNDNKENIDEYVLEKFPYGIIKYVKNNHLLSNIFKNSL